MYEGNTLQTEAARGLESEEQVTQKINQSRERSSAELSELEREQGGHSVSVAPRRDFSGPDQRAGTPSRGIFFIQARPAISYLAPPSGRLTL